MIFPLAESMPAIYAAPDKEAVQFRRPGIKKALRTPRSGSGGQAMDRQRAICSVRERTIQCPAMNAAGSPRSRGRRSKLRRCHPVPKRRRSRESGDPVSFHERRWPPRPRGRRSSSRQPHRGELTATVEPQSRIAPRATRGRTRAARATSLRAPLPPGNGRRAMPCRERQLRPRPNRAAARTGGAPHPCRPRAPAAGR
jgi:hypothetical protein